MASNNRKKPVALETSLILTDYDNMRSRDFTKSTDDDDTFDAFRLNIRLRGQDTPVLVRPHPKKEGKFQLVTGNRRIAAIMLNALDDGEKNPTILAEIREMTDLEARLAHTVENLGRVNVPAPDAAWALHQLSQEFAAAGENKTAEDIVLLGGGGISKSYGARLLRIMTALPTSVATKWRETNRAVGVEAIDKIVSQKPPLSAKEIEEAFEKELSKKAKGSGTGLNSPKDKWAETQGNRAAEMLRFVYTLQADDLLPPAVDTGLLEWMILNKFIQPGKLHEEKHDKVMLELMAQGAENSEPVDPEKVEAEEREKAERRKKKAKASKGNGKVKRSKAQAAE